MTKACEDIQAVDAVLHQWATWVKRGGSLRHLGYPSSSPFVVKSGGMSVDENTMAEVDSIIGRLKQPYKRVVLRTYIDERPVNSTNTGSTYYPIHRTQHEQARTERMTVAHYADVLRSSRFILIGMLNKLL